MLQKSRAVWARSGPVGEQSDFDRSNKFPDHAVEFLFKVDENQGKRGLNYAHCSTMIERVLIWPAQKDPERKLLLSTYQVFEMVLGGSQDDFKKCPHDSGKHANTPSVVAPKTGALLRILTNIPFFHSLEKNPRN